MNPVAARVEPGPSAPLRIAPLSETGPQSTVARWIILALLVAAPLAMGSVHEPAFIPLLALAASAGVLSWWCPTRQRGLRATAPPGTRLFLALLALVVFQMLPLPPFLLAILSPGTHAFHEHLALVRSSAWHPISVNPADTARGAAFLVAFFLLYAAVEREAAHRHWRRHAVIAVVATGLIMTVVALVQAASATPRTIYGLWRPTADWAVFGPYVNHNHFANYLVMAAPLSLALLIESLGELSSRWRVRRWLVWGDPPATRSLLLALATLTILVGLLAAQSRAGVVSSVCALALLAFVLKGSRRAALALTLLVAATAWFVDPAPLIDSLHGRSFAQTRWPLWKDALTSYPSFALFGAGLNAYGTLSPYHQTGFRDAWVAETHNDYIQVLIDTGLVGALAVGGLLLLLARRALRAAGRTTLGAGLLAGLSACALDNVVDFGWQIPANAATFVVLAGLAMREGEVQHRPHIPAILDGVERPDLESRRLLRM